MMDLTNEMERVARLVSADQGLEVHVRGVSAFATREYINIPNIETYEWLGWRNAHRMMHGLVDHEVGHHVDTDFDALEAFKKKKPSPALDMLQNVLEDGYVERMRGRDFIGSQQNIALMNEWFMETPNKKGECGRQTIEKGDLWSAFLCAVGSTVTPHGGHTIEWFKDVRPEVYDMLKLVEPELERVCGLGYSQATPEIVEVAEAIYEKFKHLDDKRERQSAKGGAPPQPGEGELGVGAEDAGGIKGDKGEGDSGEFDLNLERWTQSSDMPTCPTERMCRSVEDVFKSGLTQPYTVFSHEFDVERNFGIEDNAHLSGQHASEMELTRLAADSLALCFESSLRALQMVRPIGGADSGEVDADSLVGYSVGSIPADQLYVQHTADDSGDVAIEILCDCSGSMSGHKATLCRQAALAMSTALARVQMVHEVTGFTTIHSGDEYRHKWADDSSVYVENFRRMRAALAEAESRGVNTQLFARARLGSRELSVPFHAVFKDWSSTDTRGLMRIDGLQYNLDGEAVMWAAKRLAQRPEKRRVMFVLSDGHPAGSRDNVQGQNYLRECVQRIERAGIEVYGLGMSSDAVLKYYSKCWVCSSMSELTTLAMSALSDVLISSRVERERVAV